MTPNNLRTGNARLDVFINYGMVALAILGVSVLLRLGEWFFIPPTIALLLAALLWPAVRWLNERLRIPWSLSCLLVVLGLVLVNLVITLGFALAVPRLLQDLPDLRTNEGQHKLYALVRNQVERISPRLLDEEYWPADAEKSRIFKYVQASFTDGSFVTSALIRFAGYLNNWLWQWILIMFILLFMLMEGKVLTRRLIEVVGADTEVRVRAEGALTEMAFQVRNYIWWRTVINIGLALIVGGFYQFMGLRQAWTWALLTGILCYIPYIGPIISGVPAVIEAFLSFQQPEHALIILGVYVAMIAMEGYFFFPLLIGRGMELNATTVMLACLYWELVWGLPGLFLAMPLMAAAKAVLTQMQGLTTFANLMSISEVEEPGEDEAKPEGKSELVKELEAGANGQAFNISPTPLPASFAVSTPHASKETEFEISGDAQVQKLQRTNGSFSFVPAKLGEVGPGQMVTLSLVSKADPDNAENLNGTVVRVDDKAVTVRILVPASQVVPSPAKQAALISIRSVE